MKIEEKQNEIQLRISGMTCDSCATHVRNALERVDGVVSIDLPSWKSEFVKIVARSTVTDKELTDAVQEAGYVAEPKRRAEIPQKLVVPVTPSTTGYDVVVIGTGSAGMAAAIRSSELGYKVALVERATIGGTCVNIGCIPSKTLMRAAKVYHNANTHPFDGIQTLAEGLTWSSIISQKDSLVENLRKEKYMDVIESYQNITLIHSNARLTAEGKIQLSNGEVLSPSRIILATGARPRLLPVEGMSETDILTSTSIMELEHLPESLIVIGGRVIALELGQTYARFGTNVTVLQRSSSIIPDHEPEISEALTQYLCDENISIITDVKITTIMREGKEKVVRAEVNGTHKEFRASEVLMAIGREPNTEELGLAEVGVATDEQGFIVVDSQLRTSNPSIFAAGDVTTLPKFVYVAAASGGIAAENALKNTGKELDLTVVPKVIFTSPQVATVGLTDREAKERGHEVRVSILPLKHVPRAIAARDTRGLIKLIADVKSNTLLGAHILAAEAGEVIQTAALAIAMGKKYGMTLTDLQEMLFPYLVQVEGLKLAVLAFDKDVSKLSCCAG